MSRSYVRNCVGVAIVCLMAISAVSVVQAGTILGPPVSMSDLLQGATIQAGDKLFDDFAYSHTGDMPTPDRVNVAPMIDADGHFGIQITGGFQDLPGGGGSDAVINYSVWVVHPDPRVRINDVHLYGQLNVAGGPGNVLITESYSNTSPEFLSIFLENPSGGVPPQLSDWTFLETPVRHLRVKKDILANATGTTGIAAVTIIEQTFSQIPEPSTALLTLLVGACLCGLRCFQRVADQKVATRS